MKQNAKKEKKGNRGNKQNEEKDRWGINKMISRKCNKGENKNHRTQNKKGKHA